MIRIEPQPEYDKTCDFWIYEGGFYITDELMRLHLYDNVFGEQVHNSTHFSDCEPVLVDGVWYWRDASQDCKKPQAEHHPLCECDDCAA